MTLQLAGLDSPVKGQTLALAGSAGETGFLDDTLNAYLLAITVCGWFVWTFDGTPGAFASSLLAWYHLLS
jgi:hypothetical protein